MCFYRPGSERFSSLWTNAGCLSVTLMSLYRCWQHVICYLLTCLLTCSSLNIRYIMKTQCALSQWLTIRMKVKKRKSHMQMKWWKSLWLNGRIFCVWWREFRRSQKCGKNPCQRCFCGKTSSLRAVMNLYLHNKCYLDMNVMFSGIKNSRKVLKSRYMTMWTCFMKENRIREFYVKNK